VPLLKILGRKFGGRLFGQGGPNGGLPLTSHFDKALALKAQSTRAVP
jgi:hypothetical protein